MDGEPESRPYAEAAARNEQPILAVLREEFAAPGSILEIGSGTGQHAVAFARQMPWLIWQPTDLTRYLPGIRAWTAPARLPNLLPPLQLDVTATPWPVTQADGVFAANTAHIMPWEAVVAMFAGVAALLPAGGRFCLYGPFNYRGRYTSDSNRQFDAMLRARSPLMGIRDVEALQPLAQAGGLALRADHAMPANNRILVWERPAPAA